MLNEAPHQEGLSGSGRTTLHITYAPTKGDELSSSRPGRLYPQAYYPIEERGQVDHTASLNVKETTEEVDLSAAILRDIPSNEQKLHRQQSKEHRSLLPVK